MDVDAERVVPYELCVRNTFIEKREVLELEQQRRRSAPAVECTVAVARPNCADTSPSGTTEGASSELKMFIGNVPFNVTSERMQDELCLLGFKGTYTSINFPLKSVGVTRGYGFVTFRDDADALRFASTFHDYRFEVNGNKCKKRCYVKHAHGKKPEAKATPSYDECNTRSLHNVSARSMPQPPGVVR
eukprot:TRINITY_DN54919_c0_g1_i1.p1 TRINITY_DN54919_c0_g1~~TRINITY_DN54919_c0_g1_i1.p1  ORF type:complete len:188 (-),score=43.42 TRINITY_DN54919_c0_g1_i1:177-740(-)